MKNGSNAKSYDSYVRLCQPRSARHEAKKAVARKERRAEKVIIRDIDLADELPARVKRDFLAILY